MISLTVLCEGQTEVNFVNQVLRPHLIQRDVFAKATNLGGGLTWKKLKRELNLTLQSRKNHEWLTTMFDLYKIMTVPDSPKIVSLSGVSKAMQMEEAMLEGLPNPNFLPYVQSYEFEALLYVDLEKLSVAFPDGDAEIGISSLKRDVEHLAPEDINEGEETAPSKRLIREIPSYKHRKSTAGPQVVEHIGLPAIREKCPHFDGWVRRLEQLGQQ